jgi:hypothetical protein
LSVFYKVKNFTEIPFLLARSKITESAALNAAARRDYPADCIYLFSWDTIFDIYLTIHMYITVFVTRGRHFGAQESV